MAKAHIFDMISRMPGEPLPECSFYVGEEYGNHTIVFYGKLDILSDIPLRLDIAIDNRILVGDAKQTEIKKNGKGYEAYYSAYALHTFEDSIPI
jgi:hypothetical protein